MRSVILFFLLLCCAALTATPVPIKTLAYEWHDVDYYAAQALEWQQVATAESCTKIAWYHYYMAARYANLFGHAPAFELDGILADAEKVLAEDDFVLHYLRCHRATTPEDRFAHLRKANEVDPMEPIAYHGLALYHELEGNKVQRDSFMALVDTYTPFPRGSMDWNYNQLQSVTEDDGILVTYGDNDTYPTWLMQGKYGVKTNVKVVNLPLLINFPDYRKRRFRELSLTEPFLPEGQNTGALLLEALAMGSRPLYLGTGAAADLVNDRAEHMYLTGLTFRYTKQGFNNLGVLLTNYQTKWRLEELALPLETAARQRVADQLNQNYLPALLELRSHFENTDLTQLERTEQLINSIAHRSGLGNIIQSYLEPELPQLASNDPGLKAKQLEKQVVYVPEGTYRQIIDADQGKQAESDVSKKVQFTVHPVAGFYLQKTEVSNAEYQLFLEDLLRQRKFSYLDSVAIEPADYLALLPDSMRNLPSALLYERGHPTDPSHPVTNISHRAAQLYAIWLTQVYHQDPKRKDGQRVRFRLPTREEFIYASMGGKQFAPYPWGGPYIRNAKGCYLANFNTLLAHSSVGGTEPSPAMTFAGIKRDTTLTIQMTPMLSGTTCADGAYLSVNVEAYFPNNYGLFQMSGNAAEMIAEPGKDMGGSWLDHARFMQIGVVHERTAPHPTVGFRLVMEVVE